MVRSMLSESLRAVISQSLLKKVGGGRVAAHEIMVGIAGHPQPDPRGQGRADVFGDPDRASVGMQTLDQCLQDLCQAWPDHAHAGIELRQGQAPVRVLGSPVAPDPAGGWNMSSDRLHLVPEKLMAHKKARTCSSPPASAVDEGARRISPITQRR
jgi:hypothetical protein